MKCLEARAALVKGPAQDLAPEGAMDSAIMSVFLFPDPLKDPKTGTP